MLKRAQSMYFRGRPLWHANVLAPFHVIIVGLHDHQSVAKKDGKNVDCLLLRVCHFFITAYLLIGHSCFQKILIMYSLSKLDKKI